MTTDTRLSFSASHAKDAVFRDGGLRSCFEYRDLGISVATGGRAMAHVIRAKPGGHAGSCVHQPPGIRHAEVAHSDDLELIEITLPAEFETIETEAPAVAAKKEPVTTG